MDLPSSSYSWLTPSATPATVNRDNFQAFGLKLMNSRHHQWCFLLLFNPSVIPQRSKSLLAHIWFPLPSQFGSKGQLILAVELLGFFSWVYWGLAEGRHFAGVGDDPQVPPDKATISNSLQYIGSSRNPWPGEPWNPQGVISLASFHAWINPELPVLGCTGFSAVPSCYLLPQKHLCGASLDFLSTLES